MPISLPATALRSGCRKRLCNKGGVIRKIISPKIFSFVAALFISCLSVCSAQQPPTQEPALFKAARTDQVNLEWQNALAKFRKVIATYPQTSYAQQAHIEIGKFYKYQRDWEAAINEYHQAIDIAPQSRPAHDAKTAEAAIYYFRQDFQAALEIFQQVLDETSDWDQIKYCTYWIKEIKRKMSFSPQESFACGPESLKIALKILGIDSQDEEIGKLFTYDKNRQVSITELSKVASCKGLKTKIVKVSRNEIQNLNTPFIALVNPEHYVVVTDTQGTQVKFIDPVNKTNSQQVSLAKFSADFQGYALVFTQDTKLAKARCINSDSPELKDVKGGVCWCCPPVALGGPGQNPNVEFDGAPPCSPGMPAWMVNTVNLNLVIQDIDFRYTSRGMPIEFIRTYNGDDPRDGVFGRSWTFNYNISLVENPDRSMDIRRGDARVDHYIWNGTRYQAPDGIYDSLAKNADNTYSLKLRKDKTTYNFSAQGRLINIKDRNNNTIAFNYDAQGKLLRIIDPNSKQINLTYNANNKVVQISLADGRKISFVYDSNNNLVQSIDAKGAATNFTYDSASYITAITTPHQGVTSIQYSTSSDGYAVAAITDVLGNKRSYATHGIYYNVRITDSRNNPTLYTNNYDGYTQDITSASGAKVIFEYDALGNRNKIKDNQNNATTLTYDANGNVTSITDSLNNRTTLVYDANDNLIQATDPKGNSYIFVYDANANLIEARDADNQVTTFTYNAFGQLTRLTDAKGNINEFSYDAQGNLVSATSPSGKITQYAYDTLGQLIRLTDPKNNSFVYEYDGVGHLTKITYPDRTTTTYTYNCCNLLEAQDKNGTLRFAYDALGRMTNFTNYDNQIIGYEYDSEGNLITLTYPDNKKVNYEYDKDNRLIKVTDWLGNVTQYNYDTRGNLSWVVSPGLITLYKYNAANQLVKLINYNSTTMTITSAFEFTLDTAGNRAQAKRYLPLEQPAFSFLSSNYAYNSENQLISATDKNFEYDANGNLIRQPAGLQSINFTYNSTNQLAYYRQGETVNLAFQYDALGNRIKKTSGLYQTTKYIVDPNRALPSVLAETNASGRINAYYVYGLGLISKIVGSNVYFYQYDGLGSTVAITDSAGNIKNKYAYDDFGNLATNSTETIANPFKYVGKFGVMTDLPDLLYMRARYYVPSVGRFINKDPIGLAGGMNLYGYVGNNPIRYFDLFGLDSIEFNITAGIGIGITISSIIGEQGKYLRLGIGFTTPGISISITSSTAEPQSGLSAVFNLTFGVVKQWEMQRGYCKINRSTGVGWPPSASLMPTFIFGPFKE